MLPNRPPWHSHSHSAKLPSMWPESSVSSTRGKNWAVSRALYTWDCALGAAGHFVRNPLAVPPSGNHWVSACKDCKDDSAGKTIQAFRSNTCKIPNSCIGSIKSSYSYCNKFLGINFGPLITSREGILSGRPLLEYLRYWWSCGSDPHDLCLPLKFQNPTKCCHLGIVTHLQREGDDWSIRIECSPPPQSKTRQVSSSNRCFYGCCKLCISWYIIRPVAPQIIRSWL